MQKKFFFTIFVCIFWGDAYCAPHIKPIPVPRPFFVETEILNDVSEPASKISAQVERQKKLKNLSLPRPRPNFQTQNAFQSSKEAQSGSNQTVGKNNLEVLENISKAYADVKSLTADFVQISSNQRVQGTLLLQKPGMFLFSYQPPSTIFVVSDGKAVLVRDKKLKTNDSYLLEQTPLRILLKSNLDLLNDVKVGSVFEDAGMIAVRIDERKSTIQGEITLYFTKDNYDLKQWNIVDAQGAETIVALSNVKTNVVIDANNFVIDAEAIRQDTKTNSN